MQAPLALLSSPALVSGVSAERCGGARWDVALQTLPRAARLEAKLSRDCAGLFHGGFGEEGKQGDLWCPAGGICRLSRAELQPRGCSTISCLSRSCRVSPLCQGVNWGEKLELL